MPKKQVFEKIPIIDIADKGRAVAKSEERVIFVKDAVPGDVADLQIIGKKRKFLEAVPIHFHELSKDRTDTFCEHFGTCGGCKWQHLNYAAQLRYKQQQVVNALQRLAKIENPPVLPIIPSEKTQHYRNKLEYTFSNKRWLTTPEIEAGMEIEDPQGLGFHIPGRFDKVLDVKTCYLQEEPSNSIRLAVRNFAVKNNYSFFDLKEQTGLLRNLIIRTAATGEIMVVVVFAGKEKNVITALLTHLQEQFPEITSLNYVINPKKNDTIFDLEVHCFSGKDHLLERLGDLQFKVGPKSFFQTNTQQAEKLYQVAKDFAGLKGGELVYDLYCGIGSISLFVADKCSKVVGIEEIEAAVEDAYANAELNKITNCSFVAGDTRKILDENFVSRYGRPDVIITDPPRAGMHPKVVEQLLEIAPQKIVYVSCNPATQARDIELLKEKYNLQKAQPVDMFPHTHHIENVALLILKN